MTIQAQILELIAELSDQTGTAVLLITHNLGVAASMCDRLVVMYAGQVVESGPVDDLFYRPQMPYSWSLLDALPAARHRTRRTHEGDRGGAPPDLSRPSNGCEFAPRCTHRREVCDAEPPQLRRRTETATSLAATRRKQTDGCGDSAGPPPVLELDDVSVTFASAGPRSLAANARCRAVDGVSLAIAPGETLGLVGESGSGKTTLGHAALGLVPASGRIAFEGRDIATLSGARCADCAGACRSSSRTHTGRSTPASGCGQSSRNRSAFTGRSPARSVAPVSANCSSWSGCEKSTPAATHTNSRAANVDRVAIARALAVEPTFIVCDEPLSALDVSVQAQILNLLVELRTRLGLTYLFIGHDLAVMRYVSDRIAVMYLGRIVEIGGPEEMFTGAAHPYTRSLVSALPLADPESERRRVRVVLEGDLPSPIAPPPGCRFHTRCWWYREQGEPERCRVEQPELRPLPGGKQAACHFSEGLASTSVGVVIEQAVRIRHTPSSVEAQSARVQGDTQ